jgi:hypothetical protein
MTTITITLGIIGYLFLCFCFYAIIYVGTGGKVPIFKRRPPRFIFRESDAILYYSSKHDVAYVRQSITIFGHHVGLPIFERSNLCKNYGFENDPPIDVWIGPKINPEERDPFGKVAKEYGSAVMREIDGIVEGEDNEPQS